MFAKYRDYYPARDSLGELECLVFDRREGQRRLALTLAANAPPADHPVKIAKAPWGATMSSLNMWAPGTPASNRNLNLPKGSWCEDLKDKAGYEGMERRLDRMAQYIVNTFAKGNSMMCLQEVPNKTSKEFKYFSDALNKHMQRCNPPVELDLDALSNSWVRRSENQFGTACLINKKVLSLVPVDWKRNLVESVVGNGCMVEYHICHKQTGSVYKCVNAHSKGFTSRYNTQSSKDFETDRNALQHLRRPKTQDADSYLIMEVANGMKGDAACGGFDLNDFVYNPEATDRMEVYRRGHFKSMEPSSDPTQTNPADFKAEVKKDDDAAPLYRGSLEFKDPREALAVIGKLAKQFQREDKLEWLINGKKPGEQFLANAQLSGKYIYISDPRLEELLKKVQHLHVTTLDTKYYPHQIENKLAGRPHKYAIFDNPVFQSLKNKYGSSQGDYVKTQILKEIKYELDHIDNIDEFKKKKAYYNDKNLSYKALNTSQDWFTQSFFGKLFGIKTSSIIAFNKIVSEREAKLEREAQFEL